MAPAPEPSTPAVRLEVICDGGQCPVVEFVPSPPTSSASSMVLTKRAEYLVSFQFRAYLSFSLHTSPDTRQHGSETCFRITCQLPAFSSSATMWPSLPPTCHGCKSCAMGRHC